jgi:ribosomal protein S7
MSRKRKAPLRKIYPDPKYGSITVSKFINSIMYDGKRSTAERILYTALEKIKENTKKAIIFHATKCYNSPKYVRLGFKILLNNLTPPLHS